MLQSAWLTTCLSWSSNADFLISFRSQDGQILLDHNARHGPRHNMYFCIFLAFSQFLSIFGVNHLVYAMQSKNSTYHSKKM